MVQWRKGSSSLVIHTLARIENAPSRTRAIFICPDGKVAEYSLGLLIGAMWMGEVLLGNLGGTPTILPAACHI